MRPLCCVDSPLADTTQTAITLPQSRYKWKLSFGVDDASKHEVASRIVRSTPRVGHSWLQGQEAPSCLRSIEEVHTVISAAVLFSVELIPVGEHDLLPFMSESNFLNPPKRLLRHLGIPPRVNARIVESAETFSIA